MAEEGWLASIVHLQRPSSPMPVWAREDPAGTQALVPPLPVPPSPCSARPLSCHSNPAPPRSRENDSLTSDYHLPLCSLVMSCSLLPRYSPPSTSTCSPRAASLPSPSSPTVGQSHSSSLSPATSYFNKNVSGAGPSSSAGDALSGRGKAKEEAGEGADPRLLGMKLKHVS